MSTTLIEVPEVTPEQIDKLGLLFNSAGRSIDLLSKALAAWGVTVKDTSDGRKVLVSKYGRPLRAKWTSAEALGQDLNADHKIDSTYEMATSILNAVWEALNE